MAERAVVLLSADDIEELSTVLTNEVEQEGITNLACAETAAFVAGVELGKELAGKVTRTFPASERPSRILGGATVAYCISTFKDAASNNPKSGLARFAGTIEGAELALHKAEGVTA